MQGSRAPIFSGGLGIFVGLLCAVLPVRAAEAPVIAAAADLQFALAEIAERFLNETGRAVKLSFGSSGNLARQIAQGAPYQVFLSADEQYVRWLAEKGRTVDEGTPYALGRIVLFAPPGSPIAPDSELAGLKAALAQGRVKRFAIANPDHAPYGRAAREALAHAGLWQALEGRLVFGENVAQAMQFALSGAAEGGIVPYSLVLAPALSLLGTYALIPESWHRPLRQRMVLVRGAGETARLFHAYLREPGARMVLERHGFVLPPAAP